MDRSLVRHFSNAADTYDENADFQREISNSLIGMSDTSFSPKRILEIGAGTGLFTELLLQRYPESVIDALDIAPGMVKKLAQKFSGISNIRPILADANSFSVAKPYDLLCASAAFHWIRPYEDFLARIKCLLRPGGRFLFSVMVKGTLARLREKRNELFPAKTLINELPESSRFLGMLTNELSPRNYLVRTFFSEAENSFALIQKLRAQGYTGGSLSRGCGRLSRAELSQLATEYDRLFLVNGSVNAEFVVLFVEGVYENSLSATCSV